MSRISSGGSPSRRDLGIAGAAALLAVVLMAWDHLWGNEGNSDESFPVDAPTFFISLGLIAVAAGVVFGLTVPRGRTRSGSEARAAMVHSALAAVLALPAAWLGFPVVVAGAGVALGLDAMTGQRRRLGMAALALGLVVMVFVTVATAFPASDSD